MPTEHLPILPIIVPLLAAPLCLLFGQRNICWVIATLASAISFIASILLLNQVFEVGALSYQMGGWPPPWGIEMRIDAASALVLLIVSGLSTLGLIYANQSVAHEIGEEKQALFYTAFLLCLTGLSGIVITGDAFNLFVFLEISSLATYALVSLASDRRSLLAAFRYLVMGTLGATFILIGVGMLYAKTGTLNMLDLAAQIEAHDGSRTIKTGMVFILVGVSIKLALFPLHQWLPSAYAYAPSAVSAFLAGTATKVAVYVLLRFIFTVVGADYVFGQVGIELILLVLALLAIFKCSYTAVLQQNVKKLLAYSSVAQIGYIVLGVSLASAAGLTAGLLHIFNHALMKGALFMAVGAVFYRVGSVEIKDFVGLGRQMPWTMAAFAVGGLSLIGVPLTAGFVSKWYLVSAALSQENWLVAGLVLLGSLLAVVYVGRVLEAAYFRASDEATSKAVKEAPLGMLLPMWVLVLANIYFGIDTELSVGTAEQATQWFIEGVTGNAQALGVSQ